MWPACAWRSSEACTGPWTVPLPLDEEDPRKQLFDESSVRLLTTLAASLGTALENARLFEETRRLLAETDFAAQRIAGLALTSAAHIGVLVDADGVPVRRALLWNDQRSSSEVTDLERDHGEEILCRTYQAVSTSWTLPHLLWVRRHEPDAWARTRRVLLSKDYLAAWLLLTSGSSLPRSETLSTRVALRQTYLRARFCPGYDPAIYRSRRAMPRPLPGRSSSQPPPIMGPRSCDRS